MSRSAASRGGPACGRQAADSGPDRGLPDAAQARAPRDPVACPSGSAGRCGACSLCGFPTGDNL